MINALLFSLLGLGFNFSVQCKLLVAGEAARASWPCLTGQSKRSTHERLYAADTCTTIQTHALEQNGPESPQMATTIGVHKATIMNRYTYQLIQ